MITEDYVPFEIALRLKNKGFSIQTNAYYDGEGSMSVTPTPYVVKDYNKQHNFILCPTLQMAMKWLREVHHYYIQVMLDSWACGGHTGYYVVIQDINSDFEEISPKLTEDDTVFFQTYEEACEAAIKYALENLI